MTEGAEAETVTPELLRSMFRETHGLVENIRKETARDAAVRHGDVISVQHKIIDQLARLDAKVDAHDGRFDRLDGRIGRLEDGQQQILRQQSYADSRIDAVVAGLGGGEPRLDSGVGSTGADVTGLQGDLRAVDSSVGALAARVEHLHDDVRAIAVAVGDRPTAATQEGGG